MAQPSSGTHDGSLRAYVERMRALTKSVIVRNARIHGRTYNKTDDEKPVRRDGQTVREDQSGAASRP